MSQAKLVTRWIQPVVTGALVGDHHPMTGLTQQVLGIVLAAGNNGMFWNTASELAINQSQRVFDSPLRLMAGLIGMNDLLPSEYAFERMMSRRQ